MNEMQILKGVVKNTPKYWHYGFDDTPLVDIALTIKPEDMGPETLLELSNFMDGSTVKITIEKVVEGPCPKL